MPDTISLFALLGGSGMVLVALAFMAWALAKRCSWRFLALGALAWVVTVAIKVAIAIPSKPWVLAQSQALSQPWSSVVLGLYGGLMTGATEVGLVWLLVRYTRVGQAPWRNVLGFGVGFGAIEALLLGIGAALADSDSLLFQIAPIWERAFTCLGHLATNVMIFYAVARPAAAWFWWAFIYKSLIDGLVFALIVAGYAETLEHIWAIEAMGTVWAAVGLLATLWIARRYPHMAGASSPTEFCPVQK